jgi:hypothetical protein
MVLSIVHSTHFHPLIFKWIKTIPLYYIIVTSFQVYNLMEFPSGWGHMAMTSEILMG